MKKYLSLDFLFLLLITLGISCSSDSSNSEAKKEGNNNKEMETKEESLEPKKEKKGFWEPVKIVDEFGEEVEGKSAIVGMFEGKMSNSATTNSDIKIEVQIGTDNNSFITFYEYGDRKGNLPDRKLFKIKIKKEDGSTEFIEQFSMNNMMADTKGLLIEKVLAQETPLKINVDLKRASKYESTVYNFEINPKGLKELLKK
ncbi:MAG: hypothetical protein ACI95T_001148 [Flavobacteriales bacterium]|jgi:hypothetical protein